jgi:hypothetical protein
MLDIAAYWKTRNHKPEIQMKGAGKKLRKTKVITILVNITTTRIILADGFILFNSINHVLRKRFRDFKQIDKDGFVWNTVRAFQGISP